MKWSSDKKFWNCMHQEFVGSYKNIFLRLLFPMLILVFFWYLGCHHIKCDGDYKTVISDVPLVFVPALCFFVLLYICKPLNDYLSLRQEFVFQDENVIVKKYFKHYLQSNKELNFSRSDIQCITDLGLAGIVIHLNLTNQVLIPFLDNKDHEFLLRVLNPDGQIRIVLKK